MSSPLPRWTAGLVGDRDPAQPLLTLLAGPDRVELSGATTANWVAKTANLLVDGLLAPARIGIALPLHWQTVVLVLGGVASGATVVAGRPDAVTGCDAVFTTADDAPTLLDAGVDDVVAVSLHPLGAPLPQLPALALDFSREAPGHGDHWGGPYPEHASIEVAGEPLGELSDLGLGPDDRVLVHLDPTDPDGLRTLLAALAAGAALVLVPDPAALDVRSAATAERVTAAAGLAVAGVPRVGDAAAGSR